MNNQDNSVELKWFEKIKDANRKNTNVRLLQSILVVPQASVLFVVFMIFKFINSILKRQKLIIHKIIKVFFKDMDTVLKV